MIDFRQAIYNALALSSRVSDLQLHRDAVELFSQFNTPQPVIPFNYMPWRIPCLFIVLPVGDTLSGGLQALYWYKYFIEGSVRP